MAVITILPGIVQEFNVEGYDTVAKLPGIVQELTFGEHSFTALPGIIQQFTIPAAENLIINTRQAAKFIIDFDEDPVDVLWDGRNIDTMFTFELNSNTLIHYVYPRARLGDHIIEATFADGSTEAVDVKIDEFHGTSATLTHQENGRHVFHGFPGGYMDDAIIGDLYYINADPRIRWEYVGQEYHPNGRYDFVPRRIINTPYPNQTVGGTYWFKKIEQVM